MPSIPAIASSRCAPKVRADGSLKLAPSAGAPAGAGDGVSGAFDVVLDAGAGAAGAAGAAGVCAVAGAGVERAFEDDDEEEAAGAALGYGLIRVCLALSGDFDDIPWMSCKQ